MKTFPTATTQPPLLATALRTCIALWSRASVAVAEAAAGSIEVSMFSA